jgi:hypothetical protein
VADSNCPSSCLCQQTNPPVPGRIQLTLLCVISLSQLQPPPFTVLMFTELHKPRFRRDGECSERRVMRTGCKVNLAQTRIARALERVTLPSILLCSHCPHRRGHKPFAGTCCFQSIALKMIPPKCPLLPT